MNRNRLLKILKEINEQAKQFVDVETEIFLNETFLGGGCKCHEAANERVPEHRKNP